MFEALIQYLSGVFAVPDDQSRRPDSLGEERVWLARLPTNRQIRCVVLLLMGYPLGLVLRHVLHPSWTSLTVRHLFSSLSGLAIASLCYGWQVMALVAGVAVGYTILLAAPSNKVQWWSMGWVFVFMSSGHLYRTLTDYGGWHLDITGPMMIMVQKLSLAAFAIHDGMGGNSRPLNKDQEKQKLTRVPSVLEYMSYCFNFHSVLAGPSVAMREHLDFMDGSNLTVASPPTTDQQSTANTSAERHKEPSSLYPVCIKFLIALGTCAAYVLCSDYQHPFPIDHSKGLLINIVRFCFVTFIIRCRFYFIFALNDSISNAAGLGFEGYDKQNKPRWGLARNYDIWGMETSMNMRNSINLWNITSALWLRRVCYERVSWNPTLASFILSAWWHGFYPGYYFCLIHFGISLMAAKKMRRWCNPWFTGHGPVLRWSYHMATLALTQFYVAYCGLQLVLMWPSDVWIFYRYHNFVPTVVPLLVLLCVPSRPSQRRKDPHNVNGDVPQSGAPSEPSTKSTKQD